MGLHHYAVTLLLVSAVRGSHNAAPPVQLYLGYNAVMNTVEPGASNGSVRYLTTVNTTSACVAACLALPTHRCQTFTHHTPAFVGPYAGQCFAIVDDPMWSPHPQDNINSGRVLWPCRDHTDCSLNGKCLPSGKCLCRPAWQGPKCGELQLLPAERNSGYHFRKDGRNVSSWGGAVLRWEKDKTYHMYLAEMQGHCGISSWVLNSQVVHATSDSPTGAYKRVEVLRPPFAHEPDAIRGTDGEFVLYWSENHYQMPLCNCTDGSTHPGCKYPSTIMYNTYMSYAPTPNGPWSAPAAVLGPKRSSDTNFAAVILKNGSLVGFSRWWTDYSHIHLVTARSWKDPSTYVESRHEVFPNIGANGVEDPFMYTDSDGYFHAIFHNKYPSDTPEDVGGHAFSTDGYHWVFSGRAYGNVVHFTDGGSFTFSRRERPHLVFAEDNVTPVALTTGVQYGGQFGDATYTMLQPIVC